MASGTCWSWTHRPAIPLVDLPQRYCWGSRSLDESSRNSLFVSSSDGAVVHDLGHIELIQVEGRSPTVQWSRAASAWCLIDCPRLGADWSTTASQGRREVAIQGQPRPVFFVKTWNDEQSRCVTIAAPLCGPRRHCRSVVRRRHSGLGDPGAPGSRHTRQRSANASACDWRRMLKRLCRDTERRSK